MGYALALHSYADDDFVSEEPQIYSFADYASRTPTLTVIGRHVESPSERARQVFLNRCCPICDRATVESVELKNGHIGRNGQMVPGTGTLVGFSCNGCGHEWPIE